MKQARSNPDIEIVSFDWLSESISSKDKVDEEPYLLSAPTTNNVPAGKKRTAKGKAKDKPVKEENDGNDGTVDGKCNDCDDDEEDEKPAKKTKLAAAEFEDAEKKFVVREGKNAQKASSNTVAVPVDDRNPGRGKFQSPCCQGDVLIIFVRCFLGLRRR